MPIATLLSEFIWCIVIAVSLVTVIVLIKFVNKKFNLFPELSRKLVHLSMGILVLCFPFVFQSRITVLVLGVIAFFGMFIIRLFSKKNEDSTSFLYGVHRTTSLGELLFPLSVSLIFYFTNYNKVMYCIPILILTLADSAAALIGVRYGQKVLSKIKEDCKSLEGFIVFFIVAFLCCEIPLMLFTEIEPINIILISIIIAVLSAITEVFSSHGIDNILLPMLSFTFLKAHMDMATIHLLAKLILMVILIAIAFWWNKRAIMSKIGLLQGFLVAYIITMVSGVTWLLAPVLLFFGYAIFPSLAKEEKNHVINNHIVETNVAVAVVVLWIAVVTNSREILLYAFYTVFALRLAINTFIRLKLYYQKTNLQAGTYSYIKSFIMVLIPGILVYLASYGHLPGLISIGFSLITLLFIFRYISFTFKVVDYSAITARSGWVSEIGVLVFSVLQMVVSYLDFLF